MVKREKESLRILRNWAREPQTRKVSAHALEIVKGGDPLDATAHLVGLKDLQVSAREGQRLEHALEIQTRRLVTAE